MESIISNCELCSEHSLHVIGEADVQMLQCIHCGYASTSKFTLNGGETKDNLSWTQLTEEMKKWSKTEDDRVWIPSIITLPFGMIYPFGDKDGVMKWGLAELVKIHVSERKNHPIEGQKDKFYETKMDTDNATVYDKFYEALVVVNKKMKAEGKTPNIERLEDSKVKVVNEKDG